jgi:hypothetical protein
MEYVLFTGFGVLCALAGYGAGRWKAKRDAPHC